MPIVKDGRITPLDFHTVKQVFKDIAQHMRTGRIPGWAREFERYGLKEDEIMTEVILQISEAAITKHENYTRALGEIRTPSLFEVNDGPTETLQGLF